jgi:drug/metabolite transporter (DMT)-like permease
VTESRQVVRAEVAMLAVVLIWGANFSFMKMALGEMSGLAFAGLRFALAALILLAVLQWREGSRCTEGAWWPLAWTSVLPHAVPDLLHVRPHPHLGGQRPLIVATTPLDVAFPVRPPASRRFATGRDGGCWASPAWR